MKNSWGQEEMFYARHSAGVHILDLFHRHLIYFLCSVYVFHKDTCCCEFCGDCVFACIWPQIWKSWLTCCFPLWSISAGLKWFFSAFLHMHHICNLVVLLMCLLLTVCIIVCPPPGESGLGKSTLINSLFLTDLYSKDYPGPSQRIKKTVQVRLILDHWY